MTHWEPTDTPVKIVHAIGGVWHDGRSGSTFRSTCPADGRQLAEVARGQAEDLDDAVRAATDAFATGPWPRLSVSERARWLHRLADHLEADQERLARWEALDTGKPIAETRDGDIPRAIANLRFFADYAQHIPAISWSDTAGRQHTETREPLGVLGLITPWNLPLYLATWKLAPALMQGNCIILKPAELTPLTASRLAAAAMEIDFPPGVINIIHGFGPSEAGEALVRHPGVRAISFTGETATGQAIMAAAAPSLKKLSFELGGKGATLIFADADLDAAVPAAVRAAFRNAGQICLAGSRLLVHRSVRDEVVERVIDGARRLQPGLPLDESTTLGSLISAEHRASVIDAIEGAVRRGARILAGHGVDALPPALTNGAYLAPTVIEAAAQTDAIVQTEVFGPVVTIQTFDDDAEALALANGTAYGLSASLWTRDLRRAQAVSGGLRAGLVWVNTWFARELHTAFGGMGHSGIGREGGRHSLDFFSEAKTTTWEI